jgi:hypothetical protein
MQVNPAEDWQRLTEHYREVSDEEIEELAADYADLTETAQQALRSEMLTRGLGDPLAKDAASHGPNATLRSQWASSVNPDSGGRQSSASDAEDDSAHDFTWKTQLCECESADQAWQLYLVLKREGIDSWFERPGSRYARDARYPRVLVAADQLDQAREIAARPIPQDFIEESGEEVREFEPPVCPKCGAEDPVLESADPANAWLCEACGKQWIDPMPAPNGDLENIR